MESKDEIKNNPVHVAIIIDGNGRWGIENWNDRCYGHLRGSEVVFEILVTAANLGIKYFTVYAFSTENRKRPKEEVDYLMNPFRSGFNEELVQKHSIRFNVLGIMETLPQELVEYLHYLEKSTQENTGMMFSFCLNYSSRVEITNAVKDLFHHVRGNGIEIDRITESDITQFLQSGYLPDPDLVIRTGGELRLSNFMLWQLAYSELFFTDKYWPAFKTEDFLYAIRQYQKRNRRYGNI